MQFSKRYGGDSPFVNPQQALEALKRSLSLEELSKTERPKDPGSHLIILQNARFGVVVEFETFTLGGVECLNKVVLYANTFNREGALIGHAHSTTDLGAILLTASHLTAALPHWWSMPDGF